MRRNWLRYVCLRAHRESFHIPGGGCCGADRERRQQRDCDRQRKRRWAGLEHLLLHFSELQRRPPLWRNHWSWVRCESNAIGVKLKRICANNSVTIQATRMLNNQASNQSAPTQTTHPSFSVPSGRFPRATLKSMPPHHSPA